MPRVKAFDRDVVLKKAILLFWKKGFASTSMQDLVDHLGINRGSLYDTFGDKEKLYLEAFQTYRKDAAEEISSFLWKHPQVIDGVRAFFERCLSESACDLERKGCFVVNTTTELGHVHKNLAETIRRHQQELETVFAKYVQKGVDENQFSSSVNPEAIASILYTYLNGLRVISKTQVDSEKEKAGLEQLLLLLN